MNPRSVLIVGLNYAPEPVGIAPYTQGLAEALVARGARVRVIAGKPYYPQWRTYPGFAGGGWRTSCEGAVEVTRCPHYVPAEPGGFKRIVDAVGGVEICLKEPVDDPLSGLKLDAGKHVVNGEEALAFVRDARTAAAIVVRNLQKASELVTSFKQVAADQASANAIGSTARVTVARQSLAAVSDNPLPIRSARTASGRAGPAARQRRKR